MSRKKLFIIIAIVLASVLAILAVGWYFSVTYFGEKAFDIITESIDFENPPPEIAEVIEKYAEEHNIDISNIKANSETEAPEIKVAEKSNEKIADSSNVKTEKKTINKKAEKPKKNEKAEKTEISFSDKQAALNMVYSKFSTSELRRIMSDVSEGLTPEKIKYYKNLVKSRFSQAEIRQIIEWYYRYK